MTFDHVSIFFFQKYFTWQGFKNVYKNIHFLYFIVILFYKAYSKYNGSNLLSLETNKQITINFNILPSFLVDIMQWHLIVFPKASFKKATIYSNFCFPFYVPTFSAVTWMKRAVCSVLTSLCGFDLWLPSKHMCHITALCKVAQVRDLVSIWNKSISLWD